MTSRRKNNLLPIAESGKQSFKTKSNYQALLTPVYSRWGIMAGYLVLVLLYSIFLSYLLHQQVELETNNFEVNDIISRSIKAPRTMEIVDEEATQIELEKKISKLKPIYDYDLQTLQVASQLIRSSFKRMRNYFQESGVADGANAAAPILNESNPVFLDFKKTFFDQVSFEEFQLLHLLRFDPMLESSLDQSLMSLKGKQIVADMGLILKEHQNGLIIRYVSNTPERKEVLEPLSDYQNLISLEDAQVTVENTLLADTTLVLTEGEKNILAHFIKNSVKANLTFNSQSTQNELAKLKSEHQKNIIQIKKGEIIIRDGDRITKHHQTILKGIIESEKRENQFLRILLTGIVIGLMIFGFMLYERSFDNNFSGFGKDGLMMAMSGILNLLLLKMFLFLFQDLGSLRFPELPERLWPLALPVGAFVFAIRLLLPKSYSIFFIFMSSLITNILLEQDYFYFGYLFISNLILCYMVDGIRSRASVYKKGLFLGLFNGITLMIMAWQKEGAPIDVTSVTAWLPFILGLVSGLSSILLGYFFIPIFENIFDYTSNLRLLELSNLNHPILQRLAMLAPGTYHHSILVGSLAEVGANAVEANGLLARVGAYYHDIGKIDQAKFYIENQNDGENPHDRMRPLDSARVLISHVLDGVKLAFQHKLGSSIIAIIQQHHGTSLITYFFIRAKELAGNDAVRVNPNDFRYSGPIPQTKEAAIVMLADASEAAVRSLRTLNVESIREMINKIFQKCFMDGQLNHSGLNLTDLQKLAAEFVRVLVGLHHHRIQYPSQEDAAVGDMLNKMSRKQHFDISGGRIDIDQILPFTHTVTEDFTQSKTDSKFSDDISKHIGH